MPTPPPTFDFSVRSEQHESELFSEVIKNPDLETRRRFRKSHPKIPKHLRALINELYIKWQIEREKREILEERFLDRVTPTYRLRRKYVPSPRPEWYERWCQAEKERDREASRALRASLQHDIMENIDRVLKL